MTPLMPIRSRLLRPLRRRWLSSNAYGFSSSSSLNLTPMASPLLLRLHPDRMQRHAVHNPTAARDNEDALKQLNQFLAIAAFGCNSDGYNARKQILALAAQHHDDADAPICWRMRFHVETRDRIDETLTPVDHIVAVPASLVRRTLAHGTRAASSSVVTASPFAREWQRTTKRVLVRLFEAAHIPLYNPLTEVEATGENEETVRGTPTQLALWLQQEESEERQRERGVATHNASTHRMHRDFDKLFTSMLAKEKNIVHTTTTGLEDGPTTQHVILTRLVTQRLFLEKMPNRDEKRHAFFWLANILLMNFMELRLHSLVWNKVVLMVTKDASLESPQVLWNPEQPEDGLAVLIPANMEAYTLVDILYEHVEELELALNASATRKTKQAQQQQHPNPPRRKKKHFYSKEVDALFRKS